VEEDTYTPAEAARILRLSRRCVTQMLNAGELEGVQDPETDRWHIPQRAVHERLKDPPPARGRPNKGQEKGISESGEEAAELRDSVEKERSLTDPSSPVLGPLSAAEPVPTA
jgi:excisionase family DNA binding protein